MSFSEWREVVLKDVIEFNPKESIKKGTVTKKIGMDKLAPFQRKIDGFELAEFSGGSKFRNGDTLLARITPCLENGKTAQVMILDDDEIAFGSTEYIVMRNKTGITDNNYIFYLSLSQYVRDTAIKSMTGTSGRQRAQTDVIKNTKIMLPPLQEQKAIAHILSTLDDKIEVNNQINKTLENMAQEIFKQWFVDFEFPNEDGESYKSSGGEMVESELGLIPKGWEVASLYDIADYINGTSFKKNEVNEFEGTPIIKIAEIKNGNSKSTSFYNGTTNKAKKYYLRKRDILFSWSGNPETSIDIFIWSKEQGILNQHIFKVEPYDYSKSYIYFLLKNFKSVFMDIASNKQTTGLGHVTVADLKRLKTPIPNEEILSEFIKISDVIIEKIFNNMQEIETLQSLRDSLLPKLLSGEIRVPLDEEGVVS